MGWLSDLFGGGGSKTTTTSSSAPWGAAQPAMKLAIKEATRHFNADKNGAYFGESTVVPWDKLTRQGMGNLQGVAQRNMGGSGLSAQYQDVINQGGLNDAQRGAMQAMQRMPSSGLTGAQQQAMSRFQGLAANPFNSYQSAALKNTQNLANSNFDLNANPAFQKVLQQAQGAARDSVNMSAGGAGRYGGAIHQGNLASEVGDLTSRMVGQEYNNWQNRRDTANQNLFSMGQTGIGTQMNANTGAANIGQQGLTNRMNTQGAIFDMGQQGFGNLGNAYQGLQQPAQTMMQLGAMNEDLATRKMNDRLRLWSDKQNAPWEQIGRLNAIASGAGQMGGTTKTAAPGQNPFLSALGYGATGLGLLGGL
ncbi:hypothetical protein CN067_11900 [Sinorhizobium meliloti]|uniref:hypothetical protein n=1 Tax=Rhizobium meliloti TaxID=382 RepID=UPI000FD82A40|nr:hypothetical protein [Sinorhizobium meliloti]RVQ21828.1 hypothetical protein CN067_11900 [Sinorhizobium meliloti]